MSETNWTDDKAAQVLMAMAANLRIDGKIPRAEACEYAAARLMSIPGTSSRLIHPSLSTDIDAVQRVVRFITGVEDSPE